MKTGILTFVEADNYGAVLQACALQTYIKKLGHECELIRYRNRNVWIQYHNRSLSESKSLVQYMKSHLRIALNRKRQSNFDKFRDTLGLSGLVDRDTIKSIENKYDKIIVGSDQVWNPRNTKADRNFLLEFLEDDAKKIAYAASFGNVDLFEEFGSDTIQQVKRIPHISVRESSGREFLSGHGVDSTVVADPVLLLKKPDWEAVSGKSQAGEDYIFVYQLRPREEIAQFVEELARKTGLKVYVLPFLPPARFFYSKKPNMTDVYDAGPKEFLGYIANAKYVVTDSFHGMALSICMHRDFYIYSDQGKMNTSSRIDSLLDIAGIRGRDFESARNNADRAIDYSAVEQRLENLREISRSFLCRSLTDGVSR